MSKLSNCWLFGWKVLLRFLAFVLVVAVITAPLQVARWLLGDSSIMVVVPAMLLLSVAIVPLAFGLAASATSTFSDTGPQQESQGAATHCADPGTGIVTEMEKQ